MAHSFLYFLTSCLPKAFGNKIKVILVSKDTDIPVGDAKEKNSLGVALIYYKAGKIDENVDVFLENGEAGGMMVTETKARTFEEPKYYYRPVPIQQITLNPNLNQIFGWN